MEGSIIAPTIAQDVNDMFWEDCRASNVEVYAVIVKNLPAAFWINEVLVDMQSGTSQSEAIVNARRRWRKALGLPEL
jgi:hypothetical protein